MKKIRLHLSNDLKANYEEKHTQVGAFLGAYL